VNDGEEAHVGVGGDPSRFDPADALRRFTSRIAGLEGLRVADRLERRGGRIPVGGILERIASRRGALLGDAAGAPSPLTAGGLDPCLRLSRAAVDAVARHLAGEPGAIEALDGRRFRARFLSRLAMRRLAELVRGKRVAEGVIAALSTPLLRPLARGIFFGSGSFPDLARRTGSFEVAERAGS